MILTGSLKACWRKRTLHFKNPAGTSRGVLHQRPVWYLFLTKDGISGIGECAPLAGLGLDAIDEIEPLLDKICHDPAFFIQQQDAQHNNPLAKFPTLRFALEMAQLDLEQGGVGHYFPSQTKAALDINGLIWMGDSQFMLSQIEEKLETGWRCIKIKIGGLDFEKEQDILSSIRAQFGPDDLELRLDANGAFTPENALSKLEQLSKFSPHSIEQPIERGQWEDMADLCRISPVPIALDEELLPLITPKDRIAMLDEIRPHYIVLKPGLLGGFKETQCWIDLAQDRQIGWWITSALESNMGLHAITQWTASLKPKTFQGLGTGQLFSNNLPAPMALEKGRLKCSSSPLWDEIHRFTVDWLSPSPELTLKTSGSTGKPKNIRVTKQSMENSACLTAQKLGLKEGCRALLCLPLSYIAGKMMVVRALVNHWDLKLVEPSSRPLFDYYKSDNPEPLDFAALTPLQLSHSLEDGLLDKVKTIIVGGAPVNSVIIEKLQDVKSAVYETWGMTETVSHVALRRLNGPDKSDCFSALPGVSFTQDERGCLIIRAQHLPEPLFVTNDIVDLRDARSFRWLGRYDNVINSGGVKIFPEVIEQKLAPLLGSRKFYIAAVPDEKLGQKIGLFIEGKSEEFPANIWEPLNKFERPKAIIFSPRFKRTASGKIIR